MPKKDGSVWKLLREKDLIEYIFVLRYLEETDYEENMV